MEFKKTSIALFSLFLALFCVVREDRALAIINIGIAIINVLFLKKVE